MVLKVGFLKAEPGQSMIVVHCGGNCGTTNSYESYVYYYNLLLMTWNEQVELKLKSTANSKASMLMNKAYV